MEGVIVGGVSTYIYTQYEDGLEVCRTPTYIKASEHKIKEY